MIKKTVVVVLALMMCLTLFAACGTKDNGTAESSGSEGSGSGDSAEQSEEAASGEKIPLSMWFWGSSAEQQAALSETLVDKFNATHPEYELTVEYRSSVNKDVAVALSADEGPDIIYESSPSLAMNYIEAGKYADLSGYSEKYGWEEKLITPMYDSGTINGKLYSIPMGLNVIGVVYNKQVLEDNGWAVPTTMDELTTIMDEAMEKGMYGSVTGNKGWKPTNEDYSSMFLTTFAGPNDVYDALNGDISWNSDNIRLAVEKSAEWYQKGYLCSDYINLDWADSAMLLADGKAPFYFGPFKFVQNLMTYAVDDKKDNFQFTALPAGREGLNSCYTIGATGLLGINANTEHKDVCAEFLDMLMTNEFVKEMGQNWPGYWVVPLKTLKDIDTSDMEGLGKHTLQAIIDAAGEVDKGNFGYYCSSYMPPATFDEFVNIDTVWLGEATASELLDRVDGVFPAELEKGLVPPLPVPSGK